MMYEKEKEKRKGRPRRNWRLWLMLLLLVGGMAGFVFYRLMPQPPARPFSLVTFDVSESQDQIAFSWWNGDTGLVATRKWSDVKTNTPGSTNLISGDSGYTYATELDQQPNGSGVASVGSQNRGQLYLTTTQTLTVPYVNFMEYSPDGAWLVIYTPEREITLFQTARPNQSYDLDAPDKTISLDKKLFVVDMAISADNTLLAVVGTDHKHQMVTQVLRIADQSVAYEIKLPNESPRVALAFHPNSKQLAVAFDRTIHQIDLESGEHIDTPVLMDEIRQVDYDPTGRWLAVRGSYGIAPDAMYGVSVYDLETEPLESVILSDAYGAIKFQFLGDSLVVGNAANQLLFWEWNGERWTNMRAVTAAWDN